MFYGGGSANLGNSGDHYGGVLFAYNQSETLLWTPSASSSAGFLIYVGGLWGADRDKIESNNVLIKTTVITAGYTGKSDWCVQSSTSGSNLQFTLGTILRQWYQ